ncbi:putative nonribosomal peptide synthetase [Paecilomyces variotii]|uniref:Putative nonribosomal peptide synthetase n=1 Tax=Byssochlamys spectabilis TaxID=264951 RepID=A0A443HMH5_BYSSP|nr:putative nonribosomal peptide synthetase [Paecilomyces variotii]KAJ9237119.1 hypothetical protein DTO169E5_5314 [Paecilomyces variotii]KAJ9261120.1 hypothetical protein DTO207G8_270 [Paecilomyces variotii]KAJ9351023.1 hypothetical protein DTO027B9_6608 [Paecilomyces variotii]KAJ9351212.1 hypothetical protein DTO280E4_8358 [Paecilomyces variotii]KAJ9393015.1 hypothetical protein DTO063F5_152 [Paecilomyces variotii]
MTRQTQKPGRRLLATAIDDAAQREPDRKVFVIPKGTQVSDGFRDFTMGELAQAINYTSWWIEKNIGRSSHFETLAYIAANDIRYLIFLVACNKTGYKPFLPSTRNSDEAFRHLFKATGCSKLVYGAERQQKMLDLKNAIPGLQALEVPSLQEMLAGNATVYPFRKTYEEAENEVCYIIHSSGTTGMPKPVPLTHGFVAAYDRQSTLPLPPNRKGSVWFHLTSNDLVLSPSPFFHLMGLVTFMSAIFHDRRFAYAPDKPISTGLILDTIEATHSAAALLPPSLLEEASHDPHALRILSQLKEIYFGGAPLAPEAGDKISKITNLRTALGTSEIGLISNIVPLHREDWGYFEWNPSYGVEMEPVGDGENLYELVIPRKENYEYQGIFYTFPDIQRYHTKDLFVPHPTRPNLWKFHGRLDDVIVLSNGEKFNPVEMEKIIEGHPLVLRALVVGTKRFHSALLIEPNWNLWAGDESNPNDVADLINQIWPTVEEANHVGPAHARIQQTYIGIASKDKPFKTTPKGTTQRRLVNNDYEPEINTIYERTGNEDHGGLPDALDEAGIREYIRGLVSKTLEKPVSDEEDFYSAGLDSLQTIQIARIIRAALQFRFPEKQYGFITPQKVYTNPTVEQLSRLVHSAVNDKADDAHDETVRSEKISTLVKKYTADLPKQTLDVTSISGKHSVILTGSTGSLGSYLLHSLVNDSSVVKVYCLNRSDAKSRQEQSFRDKGLKLDLSKIEFLTVSLGEESFGLENGKYEEMLGSVDTIIHNAWMVNFNHSVDSFENTHIRGVYHLIGFCLKSKHHAHIHFISSVGTIGNWQPRHGPTVPEEPIEDSTVVLPQGYGESKHVGERICYEASSRAGVPTTIHRVGQIAGPTSKDGQWNRQEWLPTLIATSKTLGKLPRNLGNMPIDWIPVDTLAQITLELVATRRNTQADHRCAVFHLVNPSAASWTSLIAPVQKHYAVEAVDPSEWINDLEKIEHPSDDDVARLPALKLLDFYRSLFHNQAMSAPMDVRKTIEASATMKSLGPIGPQLMDNWLKQWAF